MLLEASEEGAGSSSWDGGRIAWSVRYVLEGDSSLQPRTGQTDDNIQTERQQQQQHHHRRPHIERRKLQARLEIQKDDIQAVLPISKVRNGQRLLLLDEREIFSNFALKAHQKN